jgi:2-methylcitrate dehydratase PrpD
VHALDHGAILRRHQTGRLRAGDAEGMHCLLGAEPERGTGAGRGGKHPHGGARMPALADMLLPHAHTDAGPYLVAGNGRPQQIAASRFVGHGFDRGKQSGQRDGADMQHALTMHVVELEALHGGTVDQGRMRSREPLVRTPEGGPARRVHGRQGAAQDLAPLEAGAEQGAAQRIEHQQLQPRPHLRGDTLVAEATDELGQAPCVTVVGSGMRHRRAFASVPNKAGALVLRVDQPRASRARDRSAGMTIAEELARRIGTIRFDDLPAEAVGWAKVGILDTVGVTLAGASEDCAQIVSRLAANSAGPSLLFGADRGAAPLDAALINGTAAHALDFDDCSNSMGGHPSAPVLPALFAIAGTRKASGRDFLAAYVAGFETETRIARGVNFHHYEKGWHPTATLGTFGAAAASSHLLGLDAHRTAIALSLAASLASGIKANFGTMTKPLHVGHASRNGLIAALLAADGFTANTGALEHAQGFFLVFNGAGNFSAEAVLADWATPLDILKPGIAIKQYPCCGSTHPAIDAMLELVEGHGLAADMVERVDAFTHPRRLAHTNRPSPKSALDAKFSVQYCLARALLHGRISLEHFAGDAYRDRDVQALLPRIHAAPHPDMSMASTDHFGGEVQIRTRDGRRLSAKVDRPLGRGPEKPLPRSRLEAKFLDCATSALKPTAARRALQTIGRFDELADIGELTKLLADGCRRQDAEPGRQLPPAAE